MGFRIKSDPEQNNKEFQSNFKMKKISWFKKKLSIITQENIIISFL
jgi:hypothetical protein